MFGIRLGVALIRACVLICCLVLLYCLTTMTRMISRFFFSVRLMCRYRCEEQKEARAEEDHRTLSGMEAAIQRIELEIQSIEFPRDESMDNNIVVLMSESFDSSSAARGGGRSTEEGPVDRVARELEALGFSIRRCATPEEAIEKARELLLAGQLRCVVSDMGCDVR
jgi:hypothetical protein